MPAYSGRFIEVGIAKEAVRGTAVAPTISICKQDIDMLTKVEYVDIDCSIGRIENLHKSVVVKEWAEGSISGPMFDIAIPYFLMGITGQAPTSAANLGAFDHTHVVANTNQPQSLTFTTKDPIATRIHANSVVSTLNLAIATGELFTYEAGLMGLKEVAAPAFTPAYVAQNPFFSGLVTVKLAANRAALGAALDIKAKSVSIDLDRTVEAYERVSSKAPADFLSSELKMEGSFELQHSDDTYKAISEAGTAQAMQILAVNTGVVIGTTNPTFNLIMDEIYLKDFARGSDLGAISQQTFAFVAAYNVANASMFDVVVTNTQTSY